VFHVDPSDDTRVFASLPLAVDDDFHIQRNVEEAQRVFAEFLSIRPELAPPLLGRSFVVSMISSYAHIDDEIRQICVPANEWCTKISSPTTFDMDSNEEEPETGQA